MARRAHSLEVLRGEIDARFPGRDIRSDGWIGDAAHQSRPSDHNPNAAGVVQAIDVDEHTDETERSDAVGEWLFDQLLASRDPRIKYVIYEGQMFSSYPTLHRGPAWTVGPGTGHLHHLHISVVDDPTLYDSTTPWFEEDDMYGLTEEEFFARIREEAQDGVLKAVFGRTNPESFGDRVGHIRVDTRDGKALLLRVSEAIQSLSAQVDAIADGNTSVVHSCGEEVRAALAEVGEMLTTLDD